MHIQGNQLVPELLLKVSDTFFFFLLNNCFSNLAILYSLCILDISFFIDHYCGGYLISIAYYPFFFIIT